MKKDLKATDTLPIRSSTALQFSTPTTLSPTTTSALPQEAFTLQQPSDFDVPIQNAKDDLLEDSFEEQPMVKLEAPLPAKRKRKAAAAAASEAKRSLIQVQTTTKGAETTVETYPSAPQVRPQVTNVCTLIEPATALPAPMKSEMAEDCDDGMDMFFQSVKQTIRLTNFSAMEKLDLQMSILQVIREKVFQKNGNH